MDENKKSEDLKESKPAKESAKKSDKKERRGFVTFIKSVWGVYKGEYDKITWPTRADLIKETFTVVVTSLMVGAVIASLDYLFSFGYRVFIGIMTS